MDSPDLVTGGIGALAGAVATGLLGWLTKRTEKTLELDTKRAERAPDMQETLNAAVAGVVKHYTDALARSDEESRALRGEVAELRRLVEDQTARIEDQSQRIAEQSVEIEGLVTHVVSLERAIVDMGGTPPPRRKRTPSAKSKAEMEAGA